MLKEKAKQAEIEAANKNKAKQEESKSTPATDGKSAAVDAKEEENALDTSAVVQSDRDNTATN